MICTDGDILSVNIAKENIERNFKDEIELQTIKAHKLYWYDYIILIHKQMLLLHNSGDVILLYRGL